MKIRSSTGKGKICQNIQIYCMEDEANSIVLFIITDKDENRGVLRNWDGGIHPPPPLKAIKRSKIEQLISPVCFSNLLSLFPLF